MLTSFEYLKIYLNLTCISLYLISDLKISEMDEWIDSDDDSSDSDGGNKEEDSDSGAKKKKDKKKGKAAANKKKKKVGDEAFEESDDGDEEGREKDYISDSSDRYVLIYLHHHQGVFLISL